MRLQTLSALLFVVAAPLPVTFSQTLPAGVIKIAAVEGINEYLETKSVFGFATA